MAQDPENPEAEAVVAAVQAKEDDVEEINAFAANAAPPQCPWLAFYLLCSLVSKLVPGSPLYFLSRLPRLTVRVVIIYVLLLRGT